MKRNVGNFDRFLRISLGIVVIALGIFYQSWWGLVGLVPIFTALVNWCPAYSLIGLSTERKIQVEKLKKSA
jgi:hypothetical protein